MSETRQWLIDDAIKYAESADRRGRFGPCPKCHQRGVIEVSVAHLMTSEEWAARDNPSPTDYGRIIRYCRACRTILHDTGGAAPVREGTTE